MTTLSAPDLQDRALVQQGYFYTPDELRQLGWGLRFTPFVCMLAAMVGLWQQLPAIHFALGALGILPMWAPAWHPVDRLYNHVVRPLVGGVALPPNPFPRRLACLVGGSMNVGIGLSFLSGHTAVAYVLGGILVPLQIIVITTHFCVASWMYEAALRLVGMWGNTIAGSRARELVDEGAHLVDVREPDEFSRGAIDGALNIPLDSLADRVREIADRPVVLYCQSGMRSQRGWQILTRQHGLTEVYNLGAMTRWADVR